MRVAGGAFQQRDHALPAGIDHARFAQARQEFGGMRQRLARRSQTSVEHGQHAGGAVAAALTIASVASATARITVSMVPSTGCCTAR